MLEEESLRFYKPHKGQMAFHKSPAKTRGLFGGNQSGKTYSGCNEMLWTIGKVHPYRPNYVGAVWGRDCCVTFNTIQSVLIPTYKRIAPRGRAVLDGLTYEGKPRIWCGLRGGSWKSAWSDVDKMLFLEDGSFIEFKSYEQGRESFQGPPRHIIREDEEPKEMIHTENLARQFTTGTNLIMTMTPLNYSQWCYTQVFEASAYRDDIDTFQMSSFDNPYADHAVLEKMEQDISDPIERAARLHGEFTYAQGRVWKDYGDHNYIDPFNIPREWSRTIVIDPHPEKPTAVNWFADDPYSGKCYCYREGDFKGSLTEVANKIKVESAGEYIDNVIVDPAAKGQKKSWGQDSIVTDLYKHFPGIVFGNNNRMLGWERVRDLVKNYPGTGPKLYVFKTCPVTHFQMRNYSWKPPTASGEDRSKPEVYKKNDDHCDNVRYKCMSIFVGGTADFDGFDIKGYANG